MTTLANKRRPATAFGRKLRELREAAGVTQAQLAERVDMHRPDVSRLEGGTVEPTWPTVLKLAAALGVSPNDFTDPDALGIETGDGVEPDSPRPQGKRK